jgi:methyl-accepting chemotaxis protein
MDRVTKEEFDKLKDDLNNMRRRLETTLDIIMEHFEDTEDRLEGFADDIEEVRNALGKTE